MEKFFTPKEANQLLPQVKKIVGEIIAKAQEVRALMATTDALNEYQGELIELDGRIKSLMGQLEEMGCHYKDWNFEIGLVDFPAIIHGEQALLCWRSDEPAIEWFHGDQDGYAGRRPITPGLIFS
jgi:hypothetical protein